MSGQRRFSVERCEGCGLHLELCACAQRPRVRSPFRIIVVQNNRERHKPTNTGRQVARTLVGGELLQWGVLEHEGPGERPHTAAFDDSALVRPNVDYRLIFPRVLGDEAGTAPASEAELAPELAPEHLPIHRDESLPTPEARARRKVAVVLLDGTWTQCSRMSRRIAAIATMPAFRLPPGPDSHWGIRTASEASRISTYEAAVRVLEVAGEFPEAALMQEWFDLQSARMQFMKGKRSSPEVPPEWIAERERRFGKLDRATLTSLVQQLAGLYGIELEADAASRMIAEILARKQIAQIYEEGIITRDEVVSLFGSQLEHEIHQGVGKSFVNTKFYDADARELYDQLGRALLAEVQRRP